MGANSPPDTRSNHGITQRDHADHEMPERARAPAFQSAPSLLGDVTADTGGTVAAEDAFIVPFASPNRSPKAINCRFPKLRI